VTFSPARTSSTWPLLRGGDHTIVVAAIRSLSARADAEPLLFFKGNYPGVQLRAAELSGAA
jgi:3-hydroxy-9,10-secoandrosta-1,3,5(10)-triene-9,17-dione monooxygenase reductase component